MGDLDVDLSQAPTTRPQLEPNSKCWQFLVRAAGAVVGAVASWLALPPWIDFGLIASAMFMAVGAVVAALATEYRPVLQNAGLGDAIPQVELKHLELQRSVQFPTKLRGA